MILTSAMKQLSAVIMEQDLDKLTRLLLEKGVLDFISIKEISREMENKVEAVEAAIPVERFKEVRRRVEYLLSLARIDPPLPEGDTMEERELTDPKDGDRIIKKISDRVESIREEQSRLNQELLKVQEIRRQMELVSDLSSLAKADSPYSFLRMRTGFMDPSKEPVLKKLIADMPSSLIKGGEEANFYLLLSLKRDESRIMTLLNQVSWQEGEPSEQSDYDKDRILISLDEQEKSLRDRQRVKKEQVYELINGEKEILTDLWQGIRASELYHVLQTRFSRTTRTYLFSGWLPADRKEELEKAILRICGSRCYLEWYDGDEVNRERHMAPPVALESPKYLRPFQNLVTNYSTPEYGTLNPTGFVALTYFLMFGLMFGDAGQGLVIFTIGLLGTLKGKKKGVENPTLMPLMIYCGISAFFFGLLFGSWFGFSWTPSLWFNYHDVVNGHATGGPVRSIMAILGITLWFGLVVIETGILINCYNQLRRRNWMNLFLDKGGLLGFWIIGAGFFIIRFFLANDMQSLPADHWIILGLLLPTALLFVKPIAEVLRHRAEHKKGHSHGKPPGAIDAVMEGVVEILEVYAGYLSNVLSFMRVAGLGIAHVSLMTAFFSIALMVSGGEGLSLAGIIVLLLGNILVTALEGLSAGIQSLRLNYYEFFAKFFKGSGRAYRPISLKSDY